MTAPATSLPTRATLTLQGFRLGTFGAAHARAFVYTVSEVAGVPTEGVEILFVTAMDAAARRQLDNDVDNDADNDEANDEANDAGDWFVGNNDGTGTDLKIDFEV